jgi:DNA-directed RNA polymerase specialized sigma subunit
MQKENRRTVKKPSDLDLVREVKDSNCHKSFMSLCGRHEKLYTSIITRMAKRYNNWSIVQELISDKYLVLYNSAIKYKDNKNTKFSTFLGNEAKWHYLNRCNQLKKHFKHTELAESILNVNSSIHKENEGKFIDKEIVHRVFEITASHPDKRVDKIFKLRYKKGKGNKVMPWHLVAVHLNLSAQGCINIHKLALDHIKETLKQEGEVVC